MRSLTARVVSKHIKLASTNLSLHLYDFDNTLFRSPEPPTWWKSKRHGFWFNEPSSLSEPFVPVNPNSDYWFNKVVSDAKRSISDMDTFAIMCTGRGDNNAGMRYRIAELLKGKGLDFDEVHLKPSGSTSRYKAKLVFNLIQRHNIQRIEVWEDTQKNLDAIEKVCDALFVEFVAHPIKPNPYPISHITEQDFTKTP